MGEQQIFNALVEFFEEDEWDFQWMEGMSVLVMGFSGKNGKWQCYAQARESQQQFIFYSVLPINVPENKRVSMSEFLTRVNYGMIMGNFEMDIDDGEIRYKTSIDVEGSDLTPPLIRQVVYANLIITDRYHNGVMRVLYSDDTPLQALELVEREALEQDIEEMDEEEFTGFMDSMLSDDDDDIDDDDIDDDDDDDDDDFELDDDDFPAYPPPNGNSPYSLN